MKAKYSREVLENQQLIKKSLSANEYLYKVPKPGERFKYPDVVKKFNKKINIDYYIESLFGLCARFINYDDKYQPSPESLLKVLNRKKKSKEKKLKIAKDLLQNNDSPNYNKNNAKALAYTQRREGKCLARVSPNIYL
ncbi:909_t:CDS:2 [Racocetra fulgida]|uniref:909_t:CDS:1 n=1 Tax=Racocetra fulgida TaxID=60492 RepID=A0A9N8VLQ2_9GLOM|nr:909_t:CDS:2 [Racocetra fulgida]